MSNNVVYDKLILSVTNLSFLIPLWYSLSDGTSSYRDAIFVTLPAIASMFHHAAENRFYKPALLEVEPATQELLLFLDRFFAVLGVLIFGSMELLFSKWRWVISLFGAMILSDLVMYNTRWSLSTRRILRVLLHSYWHIFIFAYLGYHAVTTYRDSIRFYQILFPCTTA